MNIWLRFVFVLVLLCCPAAVLAQEQEAVEADVKDWGFTSSLTFESGDYGTSETTDTWYLPFTLTRYFEKAEISATLPFIYQDSGAGISAVSGRPTLIRSGSGQAEGGIGDILLAGKYQLLEESADDCFNLKGVARIKFPTADENKNLGTGEFDESLGLEFSKTLDEKWALFFDMYYTFIGDPPGIDLDNEFAFSIGAGYPCDEVNSVSFLYEERTALVDGEDNPRTLSFYLSHALEKWTSVFGGISIGLSDGSPDIGLTAGLSNKF